MRAGLLILALVLGAIAYHDGAIGLRASKEIRQLQAEGFNFGRDVDPDEALIPPLFCAAGAALCLILSMTTGRRQ